jgi:uncharacterized protein YjbI with pentapeptide repeats
LANEEQFAAFRQGGAAWNEWRAGHVNVSIDLSGAELQGGDFSEANLFKANLTAAHLHMANFGGADLRGADLSGVDLSKANLMEANLSGANLRGANLIRTRLVRANCTGANLTEVDLSGAVLSETVFGNTNLTGAVGLDFCSHEGPCTLDHRTLEQSGQLPSVFLRGCGWPEAHIDPPAKGYLDTNLVSAFARNDYPGETEALVILGAAAKEGRFKLVTSQVTKAEISRCTGPHKQQMEFMYHLLTDVPFIESERHTGFDDHWDDESGGWSNPKYTPDHVWAKLREIGLDATDAHHVMLAIKSNCDVFLTCDGASILKWRQQIEVAFPPIERKRRSYTALTGSEFVARIR